MTDLLGEMRTLYWGFRMADSGLNDAPNIEHKE